MISENVISAKPQTSQSKKYIGGTLFLVETSFNPKANETVEVKLRRMMLNNAQKANCCQTDKS
ncbi:hypothetical protein FACS1894105_10810 [Clostridia bacterium]|nr:hypothetical protein FACS1894105_10810 [Clostridia bacterium]